MSPQCCSLSCNMTKRDLFLSSSWDDSVKLWSLGQPMSLRTFTGHTYCVYHTAWCVFDDQETPTTPENINEFFIRFLAP